MVLLGQYCCYGQHGCWGHHVMNCASMKIKVSGWLQHDILGARAYCKILDNAFAISLEHSSLQDWEAGITIAKFQSIFCFLLHFCCGSKGMIC